MQLNQNPICIKLKAISIKLKSSNIKNHIELKFEFYPP